MNVDRRTLIGVVWSFAVVAATAALVAALVQVGADPSADNAYRWVMALLFIGGSLSWLTRYFADDLRLFFRRR